MKKRILSFLPFVVAIGSMTPAAAVTVIEQGPNFSSAQYEQKLVDIDAKVMGGYIRFQRHWQQGEWQFNPNWQALSYGKTVVGNRVSSTTSSGSSSSSARLSNSLLDPVDNENEIYRNRYKYELDANSDGKIYRYDANKWIEKTEQGFSWYSRSGDWIHYSAEMQIIEYGNTLGTIAKFNYNGSGQVETITDRSGTIIFTLVYSGEKLASVTDYAGRQVSYHWQDDYLVRVNDLSGHDWSYSYDYYARYQGNGAPQLVHLIRTITDPENRTLTITNKEVGGRFQSYCSGSGGSTRLQERVDPDTGVVTVEEVSFGAGQSSCSQVAIPLQKVAVATEDHDGNKTQYSYAYNQTKKTYAITSINADGVKTLTEYGDDGGIKKLTKGDELVFSQAKNGSTKLQADADGNITTTNYDQYDNVTAIIHPDGAKRTASYHPSYNFATRTVNENSVVTEVTYNKLGLAEQLVEAKGLSEQLTSTYSYYPSRAIQSISLTGSAETKDALYEFEYDSYGNLTKETINQEIVWQYLDFTPTGEAKTIIDGRGHTWRYEYDNYGRLTKETNPLGHSHQYIYDKVGNQVRYIDAKNIAFQYGYDARDYLVSETDAYGKVKNYKNNAEGINTQVIDELGNSRKVIFDRSGRPQSRIDGNNVETKFTFGKNKLSGEGSFDDLSQVDYPTYSQVYKYSSRQQITQVTLLEGQQATTYNFRYDPLGRLISATDPNGHASYYSYDAFGNLTQDNSSGFTTEITYNSFGDLLRYTDRNGFVTEFDYDAHGRQISKYREGFGTWRYGYDNNDNLVSIIDPKGQKLVYTYDKANNKITEQWYQNADTQVVARTVTLTYDKNDSLAAWETPNFSEVFTRDNNGRLIKSTTSFGNFSKSYEYRYQDNGTLLSTLMPSGTRYSYEYDNNNQLTRFKIPGEGSITVNKFNWLAPAQETLPGGIKRSNQYSGLLNIKKLQVADPGGNPLLNLGYQYGEAQEIKQRDNDGEVIDYVYDPIYRLEQATTTSSNGQVSTEVYQLDANSNRVASHNQDTWQYNNYGQLTQRGSITYDYDVNGNQIKVADGNSYKIFIYDIKDRLIRVEDESQTIIAQYEYDPLDRRIAKTVSGVRTFYLYNVEGLIAEYDAQGSELVSYAYKPESQWSSNPVLIHTGPQGNKKTYYYHNDQVGTPYKVTDNTGFVVWSTQFDSFGNALNASNNLIVNNLRFPGQYFDQETGLHYNWRRYYDPAIGRYISADPIDIAGGPNLYSYVDGDPINRIDPNGECAVWGIARGIGFEAVRSLVMGDCFNYTVTDMVGDFFCGAGKLTKFFKGKCPCCNKPKNSFTADTLVVTQEGNKAIKDIEVGDMVLSYDELKEEEVYQAVNALIVNTQEYNIYAFTTDLGEEIEATELHPLYVKAKGWVESKDIRVGDVIYSADSQERYISAISKDTYSATVYNLDVVNTNTYFVGESKLLVHNCPKVTKGAGKYDVGPYNEIKGTVPGLDAHHAGQKAAMKKLVDGYDPNTGPSILVPKVGHTIKGPNGIVSRSTKGIDSARDLLARDVKELRRVYSDVPNSQLQNLINLNKEMYPSAFKK